jgi:hypothetical protein
MIIVERVVGGEVVEIRSFATHAEFQEWLHTVDLDACEIFMRDRP